MNKFIKHLSILSLVELILFVFAIANFSTISDYFLHSGMNIITSYAIGFLMGLILIASAMMLSRVERNSDIFPVILGATIGAALLAAVLQTFAYFAITNALTASIIKGAGFPIIEVALAYSASLYASYKKKKDIADADAQFDERLATMQRDATLNLDPERIRKIVEDKMQIIINARIEKFTADQLAKYAVQNEFANAKETVLQCKNNAKEMPLQMQNDGDALQTQTQNNKKNNAYIALAELLASEYNNIATADLNHDELAKKLDVNPSTIYRTLRKLKNDEKLNGHVDADLLRVR